MTANPIFRGAATALITPLNENGVDYETLGRLIDWQIAEGWALHSQLVQSGLTFLTGYRNESSHSNTFFWDYRGTETLDTPWFSVWVFFRNMINFDKRLDLNWGVRRTFDLPLDFKLALKAMFFGAGDDEGYAFSTAPTVEKEQALGVNVVGYHHPGFHVWDVWRFCAREFLLRIFRDKEA